VRDTVPDFVFGRGNRLLTPADFLRVVDQARYRAGSRHFLFLAIDNPLALHRLGMVIPRKRARRAVDRARVKRQLWESFRPRPDSLQGLDVVILLRGALSDPEPAALRAEIEDLWDKLLAKRSRA